MNWERESRSALHSGHLIDFILIAHPSYQTAAETAAKRKLEREKCLYSAREERKASEQSIFSSSSMLVGKGRKRGAHTQRPRSCHSRATCPDVRSMSCFSAIHSRYSSWQPGRIQPNEIDTIKRRVFTAPPWDRTHAIHDNALQRPVIKHNGRLDYSCSIGYSRIQFKITIFERITMWDHCLLRFIFLCILRLSDLF